MLLFSVKIVYFSPETQLARVCEPFLKKEKPKLQQLGHETVDDFSSGKAYSGNTIRIGPKN